MVLGKVASPSIFSNAARGRLQRGWSDGLESGGGWVSGDGVSFMAASFDGFFPGLEGGDAAEGTEYCFVETSVKGVGPEELNFQARRDEKGSEVPGDLGAYKKVAGKPGTEG